MHLRTVDDDHADVLHASASSRTLGVLSDKPKCRPCTVADEVKLAGELDSASVNARTELAGASKLKMEADVPVFMDTVIMPACPVRE